MTKDEELQIFTALQAELAAYWHEIDTNWGRRAGAYYSEEAVFEAGKLKLEGRDAIQEWYGWREGRGARSAAHIVSNFQILSVSGNEVKTCSYMQIYAADGEGVLPTHPPVRICRMFDDFSYSEAEQKWLCTRRNFVTLFEGGALLSAAHPDEKK